MRLLKVRLTVKFDEFPVKKQVFSIERIITIDFLVLLE